MSNIIITVIIPIYNQQDMIKDCINSLKKQTYGFTNLEIILVNDGSRDKSGKLCKKYSKRYKNVLYYEQENLGVSAARNVGLRKATGKYIFFLDIDDTLSTNTIEDCVSLFETIYDEVDLVTYPIETHYHGRVLEAHFRYQYLVENGVYDLCSNAFIGQTTMNIVVKNQFDNNLFFDESLSFSEDQKYCCDIVKKKLKMGFCKTAKYIYNRNDESSSGKLSGACYIFESSLRMFEDIFNEYEYVPMAFQGLFVNDIYWKMISNIYFPYHYDSVKYQVAMAHIQRLLRKCYNSVILDHPNMDYYEKFFLMRLKGSDTIQTRLLSNGLYMYSEGYEIFKKNSIEMVVTRIRIVNEQVTIMGFLKSVFFQFYQGGILLNAIENETNYKTLELRPSVHNYYRSHEPTQRFWRLEYECDAKDVHSLKFEVNLNGTLLPVTYYFMPLTPFSKKYNYNIYEKDFVQINLENDVWKFKYQQSLQKNQVWLYYDCSGVERDNGLEQFLHDIKEKDGIVRYYVVTDKRQLNYIPEKNWIVEFGSEEHQKLLLVAEKVITAYIENNNILPFEENEYEKYANQFHFETIYLQHGVLHIDMPWKYSPEKIIADKIVVSADVDANLFIKNGFREENLWKVKMPRFDFLTEKANGKNRILFAPSWRSYLVEQNENCKWILLENKYIASTYFKGIKDFLESGRLKRLLEKNDYRLDVKLHPIFSEKENKLEIDEDRICIKKEIQKEDYNLLVTDFSSFMFDFLYMDVPLLSFIPDFDEFTCGMNGYRKVDFMDKVKTEDICKTVDEIIDRIEYFFETGKGMEYNVNFWGNKDGKSRDDIYELLMS